MKSRDLSGSSDALSSRGIDAILTLLAHGMRSFDVATAKYWSEMLEVGLENTPPRDTWRELEKVVISYFPGRGTVFEEAYYDGEAKGEAKGTAKAVLRVLESRGLAVPDDVRARVIGCTDLAHIEDWLDRAGAVDQAEELFAGMPDEEQEEPNPE